MLDPKYKYAELSSNPSNGKLFVHLYSSSKPSQPVNEPSFIHEEKLKNWRDTSDYLKIEVFPKDITMFEITVSDTMFPLSTTNTLNKIRRELFINPLSVPIKYITILDGYARYTEPPTKPSPEIITMCGSTRFADLMAALSWEFEKKGKIVLRVNYLPTWYVNQSNWTESGHGAEQSGLKAELDELHKRKIDLSDRVYVCNYNGYIGESTKSEIDYAVSTNKPVEYLHPTSPTQQVLYNEVVEWFEKHIGVAPGITTK